MRPCAHELPWTRTAARCDRRDPAGTARATGQSGPGDRCASSKWAAAQMHSRARRRPARPVRSPWSPTSDRRPRSPRPLRATGIPRHLARGRFDEQFVSRPRPHPQGARRRSHAEQLPPRARSFVRRAKLYTHRLAGTAKLAALPLGRQARRRESRGCGAACPSRPPHQYRRDNDSATHTGFVPPSRSIVASTVICAPPSSGS